MIIKNSFITAVSILMLLAGSLSGCAPKPTVQPTTPPVIETDLTYLAKCQFLGQVSGRGWGLERAKSSAKEKAGTLGATHIYFEVPNTEKVINITGLAYRCLTGALP